MQRVTPLDLYRSEDLDGDNTRLAWDSYARHFLLDGDSWLGAAQLPPQLRFHSRTCGVSVKPGAARLRHLVQINSDPVFRALVEGPQARPWSAWLMSLGLDDLLDAVQVPATGRAAHHPHLRLLRKQEEWGDISLGARRYFSENGWQTFERYYRANLDALIQLRDQPGSLCRGVPVFLHTYALPTPRNAAASAQVGPWFYRAVKAYAIPITDWVGVAELLMEQFAQLLMALGTETGRYPNLHVYDSLRHCSIERAGLGEKGVSGDWADEMHLTPAGYAKLASCWVEHIENLMQQAALGAGHTHRTSDLVRPVSRQTLQP